ncbi:molybdenum cofactor biosynthesis protein MoaE [Galbitalea sp. SE-J8]|uniref:molybdenum cofactor biosynthesis protein MoaE n=1 Tax=Galbitalea sp. SE-J8 TaxID=3054952 RepID=UPI00259D048D|nr:molybdenum cofactor biosynthesis protein MoaE [Galbitalea sp. SE-J8]MDM4762874.1 molybdenum cofactor biosynthesis protein MoaE [Galbitalea sp. SE-J8]
MSETTDAVVAASVTEGPIDAESLERAVLGRADGALVTFRGVVRDHDGGRGVTALEYEAHPDAADFVHAACVRIAERFSADAVTVAAVHRVGALAVGDVALVATAASAHRAVAFAACQELVDDIKATVPIWKRQRFTDGESEWVGL